MIQFAWYLHGMKRSREIHTSVESKFLSGVHLGESWSNTGAGKIQRHVLYVCVPLSESMMIAHVCQYLKSLVPRWNSYNYGLLDF